MNEIARARHRALALQQAFDSARAIHQRQRDQRISMSTWREEFIELALARDLAQQRTRQLAGALREVQQLGPGAGDSLSEMRLFTDDVLRNVDGNGLLIHRPEFLEQTDHALGEIAAVLQFHASAASQPAIEPTPQTPLAADDSSERERCVVASPSVGALRVTRLAAQIQRPEHRARYTEESSAELVTLARHGCSRRTQLAHALRFLGQAPSLRLALSAPHPAKKHPDDRRC